MLSPPLGPVRADGELALAHLLGLGPDGRGLHASHLRGVALALVFALALALALLGLDAAL